MKKPFIYLLTAGLAISMIANTNTIYAVGTDSSEASVQFTAPTDSVNPVNPREPESLHDDFDESDPEGDGNYGMDGNVTGQSGPLSLDYISNIDFSNQFISANDETYESTTTSPFVQVTDLSGTGDGWNVTAAANRFTNGSEETLPGAVITFANGTTNSTSSTAAPSANTNIVLNTDETTVNVATAAASEEGEEVAAAQGLGTWVISWLTDADTNENVTLYVPESAATEGTHTAFINWTLEAGPTADSIGE